MRRLQIFNGSIAAFSVVAALIAISAHCAGRVHAAPTEARDSCPRENGGLTLPPGFCATVFADRLGHVRQMAVAKSGVVYVNTWSGRYYGGANPPPGGFLIALKDSTGDGRADTVKRFGASPETGGRGGTGIALYNGALYAEESDKIVRYALPTEGLAPTSPPETIVSGLPLTGDHPMHPFAIDETGNLYLDSGSATNSCQARNRMLESPGLNPCKELETRAGIWLYDANRTGQIFSPAERFATGVRNGEGFAIDAAGVYVTQHGRDQLAENWPKLYTPEQGVDEPAEEIVLLKKGADYGWPECYYDSVQRKLMLAPEYGGDGKTVGLCAEKQGPVAAFPAHWAPNDLLLYRGSQFPGSYQGGFFVAFHGSWNRAPAPQGGYNVVFQPIADGKPAGDFVVFADGFAGAIKEPGGAAHRPTGLALGPDGSLYVSDDVAGRIWRITFHGNVASEGVEGAPAAPGGTRISGDVGPPEGVHPEAGASEGRALPTPAGATDADVELGARIFNGQAEGGACAGCHGQNGAGSPVAPNLTSGKWLWSNGSLASIRNTITNGVAQPKEFRSPMPAKGGASLSEQDVSAVAAYVWAISRQKR
jgi:glucose/arabinose dehydrogenase/mono/diheme cytochrome c family protein